MKLELRIHLKRYEFGTVSDDYDINDPFNRICMRERAADWLWSNTGEEFMINNAVQFDVFAGSSKVGRFEVSTTTQPWFGFKELAYDM